MGESGPGKSEHLNPAPRSAYFLLRASEIGVTPVVVE